MCGSQDSDSKHLMIRKSIPRSCAQKTSMLGHLWNFVEFKKQK
ncbi:unnamed protein product [Periconia digitata]|uniref:Uncharacterized protein n=1 Tax=Periconia digitata TaxID=1303443 RepID=A0A9W4UJ71_9PLEO|nr:unnamed protein product [Periconia digitata]